MANKKDKQAVEPINEMVSISAVCESEISDVQSSSFEHKDTATATSEDIACEVMTIRGNNMRLACGKKQNDPSVEEVKKYEQLIDDGVNSINTSYLNIAYALYCIYSKQLAWCYEFKNTDTTFATKNNNAAQFNAYVQERYGLSKTASSNLLGIGRNFLKLDPDSSYYRLPELKEECKDYSFSQLCEILPFFIEHNALVSSSKVYSLFSSNLSVAAMREKKKKFVYEAGEFVEKLKAPKEKKLKASDIDDSIYAAVDQKFENDDNFGAASDDNHIYRFRNDVEREKFIRAYDLWPTCGKNILFFITYKILYFNNGDRLVAFVYPRKDLKIDPVVKYFWYKKNTVISAWDSDVSSIVEYIRRNKLAASFVDPGQLSI